MIFNNLKKLSRKSYTSNDHSGVNYGCNFDKKISSVAEIVEEKFYFATTRGNYSRQLQSTENVLYFTTDDDLVYLNFYNDFGPLNLSCLYKFCCHLESILRTSDKKLVVYYCSGDEKKKANAAFLVGSFAVLYFHMTPRRIFQILSSGCGPFRNFLDASQGVSNYTLHLTDCLHAVGKARAYNLFDFEDFNLYEYDKYSTLQNGDMNWLVPGKFLAFVDPMNSLYMCGHLPAFYVDYFWRNNVGTMIRLNNKTYDAAIFKKTGIKHHDLMFPDGTVPMANILENFLKISENTNDAIAVHCKAGLGRTGTLISCFLMKHYQMTAREAIAWVRICRPGSVIGHQQGWLEKIEPLLWTEGIKYRYHHFGNANKFPCHKFGIYSMKSVDKARNVGLEAKSSSKLSSYSFINVQFPNKYPEDLQKSHTRKNTQLSTNLFANTSGLSSTVDSSNENRFVMKRRSNEQKSYLKHREVSTKELLTVKNDAMRKTQGDYLNEMKAKKYKHNCQGLQLS